MGMKLGLYLERAGAYPTLNNRGLIDKWADSGALWPDELILSISCSIHSALAMVILLFRLALVRLPEVLPTSPVAVIETDWAVRWVSVVIEKIGSGICLSRYFTSDPMLSRLRMTLRMHNNSKCCVWCCKWVVQLQLCKVRRAKSARSETLIFGRGITR